MTYHSGIDTAPVIPLIPSIYFTHTQSNISKAKSDLKAGIKPDELKVKYGFSTDQIIELTRICILEDRLRIPTATNIHGKQAN